MHKLFLTSIILFSSSVSHAINLEEALTSGYKNHEDLKIIRTEFLSEIEQFPVGVADFMPKVIAEVGSTNNRTKKTGAFALPDNVSSDNSNYSRALVLQQPIFNGGSSVAALKAAQSSFRVARSNYYAKEQGLLFDEITLYLNCVVTLEKYNITKISVKSNRKQLEAMREKFRLGESTETEVATAQTGLASAESNQASALSEYEAAKANFYRVFSLEPVNVEMPGLAPNLPSNLNEFTEIAISSNHEMHSASHKTIAAKAGENVRKGALLPRVSFKAQAGKTLFDPEGITGSNNHSVTTTLSVTVPILERGGAEYSDVRKAKYETRRSVAQMDASEKAVIANCRATWEAYNAYKTRLEATEQGVRAANIAYEGILQEEKLGSKTIIDVLNFEDRLNAARNDRVNAERDLILASYRIKSLMGDLTAEKMKLPVEYFDPNKEFKKLKLRIVGF